MAGEVDRRVDRDVSARGDDFQRARIEPREHGSVDLDALETGGIAEADIHSAGNGGGRFDQDRSGGGDNLIARARQKELACSLICPPGLAATVTGVALRSIVPPD